MHVIVEKVLMHEQVDVKVRVLSTSSVPHVCPSSGTLECRSYWIPMSVSARGMSHSQIMFATCAHVHYRSVHVRFCVRAMEMSPTLL